MNISNAINIKKAKLRRWKNNRLIIERLNKSISRHKREMRGKQRRRRWNRRQRAKFIKRRH